MKSFHTLAAVLALSTAATFADVVSAQGYGTVPQASDSDRLAAAMRTLGRDPRNVDALITAGELSLRLGDSAGAAALFKRAEQVEPRNGRIRAGMASILVHEERPGEALRYFSQAESFGLPAERFAAERGLAFDLIGQQDRAQRDYRLAMRTGGTSDEVIRRYALSLGISGQKDLALEQIDTLLRRSDRGAWRVRAFVLAMNGDVKGAEKIAASMMPPGTSSGLAPFFSRLAGLGAADRAFAVHFGETRSSPARLADFRMAPALAALAPDPYAPRATQLAAAPPAPTVVATKPERRDRRRQRDRDRDRKSAVQAAAALPAPTAAPSLPSPPVYAATVQPLPGGGMVQPLPGSTPRAATSAYAVPAAPATVQRVPAPVTVQPLPRVAASTAQVASVGPVAPTTVTTPAASAATVVASAVPPRASPTRIGALPPVSSVSRYPAPVAMASVPSSTTSQPVRPTVAPQSGAAFASYPPANLGGTTVPSAALPSPAAPSVARVEAPVAVAAAPYVTGTGLGSMAAAGPIAPVQPASSVPPVTASAAPLPPPPRSDNDSVLARIIANISVPGAELGVAPVRPEPVVAAVEEEPAKAVAAPVELAATTRTVVPAKPVAAVEAPAKPDPKAAAARRAADRKAAAQVAAKKEADERALAAKKAAADARALAAKEAAEEKRIARSQPARIWVQVAGGANESDLPKAFSAVRGKAAALAGRDAYSTPLRATNRVLTGPFKTDAEARSFVNQLAKQGVSAFTFTSTPGQKITKLPAK